MQKKRLVSVLLVGALTVTGKVQCKGKRQNDLQDAQKSGQ